MLHLGVAGTMQRRSEQRLVEVGQGARLVLIGGEISLKPPDLRRGSLAADLLAVAVEGDDVPFTQIVGVVALAWLAGRLPEVVEVVLDPFGVVLVVTRDKIGRAHV